MSNAEIAAVFEEISDILEFQGENPFRVRAYRHAARSIGESDIALSNDRLELTKIDGIGNDLADKIIEIITTGKCEFLESLQAAVSSETLELMRVPGLGAKNAARLHKELGIQNVHELKISCTEGKVRKLKGFGEATEKKLLSGVTFITEHDQQRLLWVQAEKIVKHVIRHLKEKVPSITKIEPAGSFRRCKETVGDIDLLVIANDSEKVFDALAELAKKDGVLARGPTKMSILCTAMDIKKPIQIDCRVVPAKSFGAALAYFTGSQAHNVEMRKRAKDKSLLLNEYGIFPIGGKKAIAGKDEADIYRALALPWIPPELREMRREFYDPIPDLISLPDLRGDLHSHTTESDGMSGPREMALAAKARGLDYYAITDHSKRVKIGNGLNEERLLAQWKIIDDINAEIDGFTLLKGVEVDILDEGGLDISDDVLAQADWVVASLHFGQGQSQEKITKRLLGAIENPNVCVIGHPTGRILNDRPPYALDENVVFSAAAEHGVFLELNSHPKRLDLNDVHCALAKRLGIKIIISSDAHTIDGLSVTRFGINQARRAGLTKDDVANTRPWSELKKMLRK